LLQVFVSVCQAIAYANARGVIHRDVKPENVILGKYGEVVLLDWGLAKTIGAGKNREFDDDGSTRKVFLDQNQSTEQTAAGVVLGTPAYMAPEQACPSLNDVDERTDVYGLGSTLYVILTGRTPHKAASVQETLEQVGTIPVRRAREINRSVPPALDAICAKATAFRPEDRYANAEELALDVQRYLADEPIEVYRDRMVTRMRRWMERNRLTFFIVASILPMFTLLLLAWCVYLQSRLSDADRRLKQRESSAGQQLTRPSATNAGR
jgi:serine/threonine protein kinase